VTAKLDKPLKRELIICGHQYVVTLSPEGIKLALKGKRKGYELDWESLVSGDAALAPASAPLQRTYASNRPFRSCLSPSICAASPPQSAISDCLDRWPIGWPCSGASMSRIRTRMRLSCTITSSVSPIDHMRYATVERRGTSVEREQQDG
jgi:hypothetical protein